MEENDITESFDTQRWLQQRQRPGNWIDVAETDDIPSDIVGWRRTILNIFQIAFVPEIKRRLSKNQLGNDFFLSAAQLIQPQDGENDVRLNEEVRGLAVVRAERTVHKGEPVFLSDLTGFVSFDLPDDELDAGHFTMLWNGSGWILSFDFRAGRAKCSDMLVAARQFLEISKLAASKEYERPSVDNLFSACELVSKAHLILHRNPVTSSKKHRAVKNEINRWRRYGNVNEQFVRLFNRISEERSPARYDPTARVQLSSQSDFCVVEREIDKLMESVASRVDR